MTWINCEDELPPDFEEVLFFAKMKDGNSVEIMSGHREKGAWKHCCMFYSSITLNSLAEVTQWKKLPEYPK